MTGRNPLDFVRWRPLFSGPEGQKCLAAERGVLECCCVESVLVVSRSVAAGSLGVGGEELRA